MSVNVDWDRSARAGWYNDHVTKVLRGLSVEHSIGMRQNLVFDTSAHRKPVKFDQHRSYI